MTRSAAQIRQEFIDFFHERGHEIIPSSSVVPHDDPTLLFANAGMNQFKPYFLGTEKPKDKRVANTQKCIRAGGKHNDLDDVGHDTYHHTFFEMLGNWSFGDYFKKEAIEWAWELLTKVWGLDKSRLHATYFEGDEAENLPPDVEARDLWASVTDIDPAHIHPGNKKDNFWEMGATGPCGPCSEIHIDLTPDKSGAALVNAGDARAIELWNLVFIQFSRGSDGKLTPLPSRHVDTGMGLERVAAVLQGHNNNYATDVFVPLIQAIENMTGHRYGEAADPPPFQGGAGGGLIARDSNPPVVPPERGDGMSNRYATIRAGNAQDEACRVIADHIRCLTFAMTDGCMPDREGRGYVLRRILRRAVRFGWQHLNLHEPFLCRLVDTVVDVMGEAFPELKKNPQHIKDIIREEEESFERTLDRGIELFNGATAKAVGVAIGTNTGRKLVAASSVAWENEEMGRFRLAYDKGKDVLLPDLRAPTIAKLVGRQSAQISGEDAFKLHDTYGFPIDLTQIMADEKGLRVDIGEYERLMEEARERARAGGARGEDDAFEDLKPDAACCDESPIYLLPPRCESRILTLRMVGRGSPPTPTKGQAVAFRTDRTCFYPEQGGQVSDTGTVRTDTGEVAIVSVERDAYSVVHNGYVTKGQINVDQRCEMEVSKRRFPTMQNHTATHILNWALREVLGDQVEQKGSLVDHEKTRFDFSHRGAMTAGEIGRVERLVSEQIKRDLPVHDEVVAQQEALKINGLRAVFGERYPDMVRVLSIGAPIDKLRENPDNPGWRKCSIEFCGGTHVKSTGEIEHFVLVSEEAVAKGIRRVVGLTGSTAKLVEEAGAAAELEAESLRNGPPEEVAAGLAKLQSALSSALLPVRRRHRLRELIGKLQSIVKKQQKSLAADAAGVVNAKIDELLESAEKIGDTAVVVAEMPDVPIDQLKNGADRIKQTCKSAAILFGVRGESKATLLAAVSPNLIKKGLKAGDLVKHAAPIIQGGGGGPPTMAQAGGKNPEKLSEALDAGRAWIIERLA